MNILKIHINEKFFQDSDPIKDLNIGYAFNLYKKAKKLTQNDSDNLYKWISYIHNLKNKIITGTFKLGKYGVSGERLNDVEKSEKITKEIKISICHSYWNNDLDNRFIFVEDYNGNSYYVLPDELYLIQDESGKVINEKFTQESDPIFDLNIGLAAQLDKWIKTTEEYKMGYTSKEHQLWICSRHNQVDFVRYLLENGADVHTKNDYALRWASSNGHDKVVKLLLDAGADVHADGDIALRWASYTGHEQVVKLLLDVGADVHAENDAALRWASENGYDKVVKILKDHIAKEKKIVRENLNEKFTQDSDPIKDLKIGYSFNLYDKAIELTDNNPNNLDDWVDYYINLRGKNITGKVKRGEYGFLGDKLNKTFKSKKIFKKIKILKCNSYWHNNERYIFIQDYNNKSYYICKDEVYLIQDENDKIYEKFKENSDPVSDLGIGMKAKIIKWLKGISSSGINDYNVNINNFKWGSCRGYNGLLCFCAEQNKLEFVKYLVNANLADDIEYPNGENLAIRWAAARGNVEMIKFLIEKGADPNKPIEWSTLSCAIVYKQTEAAKYLMNITDKITMDDINLASYDKNLQEKLKKLKEKKDGKSK